MWCRSAVNRNFLSFPAACRTRSSALDASFRLGVRTRFAVAGSLWPVLFTSITSATGLPGLVTGTSQVLQVCPTSQVRSSSAYVP